MTTATTTEFSMQTVSPNIYVNDIKKTIGFYETLGFNVITTVGDQEDPVFALLRCGEVSFMFQTFKSIEHTLPAISRTNGGSLLLYVNVKGIRGLYEKIKDKVAVIHSLDKTFYGATEFSILDNNNYLITFAEDE
jgi:catechol 2,3-dioxygenase-like lactoylglutathione lyase family enzyme